MRTTQVDYSDLSTIEAGVHVHQQKPGNSHPNRSLTKLIGTALFS